MSIIFECWLDFLVLNNSEKLFQNISPAVLGRNRFWIRQWEHRYTWRESSGILPALHQSLSLQTGPLGQAVWASPGACHKCRNPDLPKQSLHLAGHAADRHMPMDVWAAFRERTLGSSGEVVPKRGRAAVRACSEGGRAAFSCRRFAGTRPFLSRTPAACRVKLTRQPLLHIRQLFTKLTDLHPLKSFQVHITHLIIYDI